MRKFAFLFLFFSLCGVTFTFAQPRDLFQEFEEEVSKESALSSVVLSSSSVGIESSSMESLSSTQILSSSSELPLSSSILLLSSSENDTTSISQISSSLFELSSSSEIVTDSVQKDSIKGFDSLSNYIDSTQILSDSKVLDSLSSSSSLNDTLSSSSIEISEPSIALSSSSMSRRDLLGPVKVSKVNGIDEMKGKYKSPRKALFMSLVIPGSGQLYVGGSTFTYVRGGIYLALEASLWGSWAYFSIHKYNDQVDKYKKFAKKHYSIGRYEIAMRDLYKQLSDETEETRFESRYMNSREGFCEALYGIASSYGCFTKGLLFNNDKNHLNKFIDKKPLGNEIDALNDVYNLSHVYQEISDKAYVLGWDDVKDNAIAINLNLETDSPEKGTVPLGSSSHLDEYRDMRSKANDYADMQVWFFGGIILNHIVSAVDAAFTANSHNKALYSEELSWYNRLNFDSYVSLVNGFDLGFKALWGF